MTFESVVTEAQKLFPVQIKYKNEDTGMNILGKLMVFNPSFMTKYITTIGYNVYYPSQEWIQKNPQDAIVTFIHECTHMYDEKTNNSFLWKLGYLFPQWLSLFVPFLLFFLSWKVVLPLVLFFLLPLPAPFRMMFERKAYCVGTYAAYKLYNVDPVKFITGYTNCFKNGAYYWMWIFGVDKYFTDFSTALVNKQSLSIDISTLQMADQLIAAA